MSTNNKKDNDVDVIFKNQLEKEKYIYEQANIVFDLIAKKNYSLAQKIINDVRSYFPYDIKFLKLQITLLIINKDYETALGYTKLNREHYFVHQLTDIYCFLDDKKKLRYLYDRYYANPSYINKIGNKDNVLVQKYYIMGRLGFKPKGNALRRSVKLQQVYSYSEERLFEFIERNIKDNNNPEKSEVEHYYFKEDVDIRELYYEIKPIVEENLDKGTYYNSEVRYSILYPGLSPDEKAKYLTISCMCGSSNIISFYPDDRCFGLISKKENDLPTGNKPIKKTLTGIERFNKRYNL